MISVVIPTLQAAHVLPGCLSALVPAVVDGVVSEVIVCDAGSLDDTRRLADDAGCHIVTCDVASRGAQLRAGAAKARKPWLLFLHADTCLEDGWHVEAAKFMRRIDAGEMPPAAAAFRFALDDASIAASVVTAGVQLRCRILGLPFGDQALLIPRALYDACGGYPDVPLMEDVALIRAVPRRQRALLNSRAITSAERYRRDGYSKRVLINWACLAMYLSGVSADRIGRFYRRSAKTS